MLLSNNKTFISLQRTSAPTLLIYSEISNRKERQRHVSSGCQSLSTRKFATRTGLTGRSGVRSYKK